MYVIMIFFFTMNLLVLKISKKFEIYISVNMVKKPLDKSEKRGKLNL